MNEPCDFKKNFLFWTEIYMDIKEVLSKPHLEFLVDPKTQVFMGPASVVHDETYRGVFGYVCFGEYSAGQVWWHPANFVNFRRQVFTPPPRKMCQYLRVWMRPGVVWRVSDVPSVAAWSPPPPP